MDNAETLLLQKYGFSPSSQARLAVTPKGQQRFAEISQELKQDARFFITCHALRNPGPEMVVSRVDFSGPRPDISVVASDTLLNLPLSKTELSALSAFAINRAVAEHLTGGGSSKIPISAALGTVAGVALGGISLLCQSDMDQHSRLINLLAQEDDPDKREALLDSLAAALERAPIARRRLLTMAKGAAIGGVTGGFAGVLWDHNIAATIANYRIPVDQAALDSARTKIDEWYRDPKRQNSIVR